MKDQRGRAVMKKTDQIIKTQVKLGQKKWFDPRPCQYVPGPRLKTFLQTNSSDEPTDQDLWANYYENGIKNILQSPKKPCKFPPETVQFLNTAAKLLNSVLIRYDTITGRFYLSEKAYKNLFTNRLSAPDYNLHFTKIAKTQFDNFLETTIPSDDNLCFFYVLLYMTKSNLDSNSSEVQQVISKKHRTSIDKKLLEFKTPDKCLKKPWLYDQQVCRSILTLSS